MQPSQNHTDTSFKAKRVLLKEQVVSPSGQSLSQLLPLLNHHNDSAREAAIGNVLSIVCAQEGLQKAAYPALVERLMTLILDPHRPVRVAAAEVTCALVKAGRVEQVQAKQEAGQPFYPFLRLFMLHVCSALSS